MTTCQAITKDDGNGNYTLCGLKAVHFDTGRGVVTALCQGHHEIHAARGLVTVALPDRKKKELWRAD